MKSIDLPEGMVPRYRALLASYGIPQDRLTLHPYVSDVTSHVALYHGIDIALDTFPYNGTTTTCEALWMGVPVITLRGDTHRARVGASLLSAIGHPELIGEDLAGYERTAITLANDPTRLRGLHTTLRPQMAASPLCDPNSWAREFETALRSTWQTWCGSK